MSLHSPIPIDCAAEYIGHDCSFVKNGDEVVVVGGLDLREWYSYDTGEYRKCMSYYVEWPEGSFGICRYDKLRRLPPKDDPTTWEQVEELTGWTPGRVEA